MPEVVRAHDRIAQTRAALSRGRKNHAAGDSYDLKGGFQSDYAYFQYHLVEFVTEHMIDLSRAFHGDLQQVLILAIVGQSYLNGRLRSGDVPHSITASSIADITNIPRQTVRRKLASLRVRGWIEQRPDQSWQLSIKDGRAPAAAELRSLDARGIQRGTRLALAYITRLNGLET
jgi:hypothetical protein